MLLQSNRNYLEKIQYHLRYNIVTLLKNIVKSTEHFTFRLITSDIIHNFDKSVFTDGELLVANQYKNKEYVLVNINKKEHIKKERHYIIGKKPAHLIKTNNTFKIIDLDIINTVRVNGALILKTIFKELEEKNLLIVPSPNKIVEPPSAIVLPKKIVKPLEPSYDLFGNLFGFDSILPEELNKISSILD